MNELHRHWCRATMIAAGVAVATLVASTASSEPNPKATPPAGASDTSTADGAAPSGADQVPVGAPVDRIETTESLPPSTIEVTALDAQSVPVAGIHLELLRDRQSVSEGSTSTKWQATSDASGSAKFTHVPAGSDSQYRVIAVTGTTRYGTRPFPVETRAGTKVVFHVYPVVGSLKDSLVAGRGFIFVDPRDEVLSIEYMQQFHNLGRTVFDAAGLALGLPKGWKAFATNPVDADLSVVKTDRGVDLVGAIAPGQHSVAFTFQVPSSNRDRIELDLSLWPNTAEAQVATLARPGLELHVEGFPNATIAQGNGRQPMLVTAQSFTLDSGPPESLRVEVAGLPVVGPGRWVAAIGAALLGFGALLMALRGHKSVQVDDSQAAARLRVIDELVALERAHRQGQVGEETFAATREILLAAFVRLESELVNA